MKKHMANIVTGIRILGSVCSCFPFGGSGTETLCEITGMFLSVA